MASTSYLDIGAVQRPLSGATDGDSHLDIGAIQRQAGNVDAPPPTIGTLAVPSAGTTLTGVLSKSSCTPASGTGGFTLSGTSAAVASWAISGTTLTLTLLGTVDSGQAVRLSYARASTTDNIADAATNYLADFSGAAVTNN